MTASVMDRRLPIPRWQRLGLATLLLSALIASAIAFVQAGQKSSRILFAGERDDVYRSIKATTDFGRVLIGADGRIISWNHGMTKLLGWTSKDMVGHDAERLFAEGWSVRSRFDSVFTLADTPWHGRGPMWLRHKDGQAVPVSAVTFDIATQDGGGIVRELSILESWEQL